MVHFSLHLDLVPIVNEPSAAGEPDSGGAIAFEAAAALGAGDLESGDGRGGRPWGLDDGERDVVGLGFVLVGDVCEMKAESVCDVAGLAPEVGAAHHVRQQEREGECILAKGRHAPEIMQWDLRRVAEVSVRVGPPVLPRPLAPVHVLTTLQCQAHLAVLLSRRGSVEVGAPLHALPCCVERVTHFHHQVYVLILSL